MGVPSLNFFRASTTMRCCCLPRHHRVRPLYPVGASGDFMVQVKPYKFLRIVRRAPKQNPRERDAAGAVPATDGCLRDADAADVKRVDPREGNKCEATSLLLSCVAEQLVTSAFVLGFQEYVCGVKVHCYRQTYTEEKSFEGNEPLLNDALCSCDVLTGDGIVNPAYRESSRRSFEESDSDNDATHIALPDETTANLGAWEKMQNKGAGVNAARHPAACKLDSTASHLTEMPSFATTQRSSQENLVDDDTPLMFFVHGVGGSAHMWSTQMNHFSNLGYESIAVDLIGHGFSSMPKSVKEYTFRTILNDLLTIFDRFSKQRNIIIGHSYGCSLSAAMSQERSTKVSHLVLISGGGPVSLRPHPGILSLPACLVACMKPFINCGLQRRSLYSAAGRQMLYCNEIELPRYVLHHIQQGQKWLEGDLSFYKQIKIPTLLIYGLRDPYITLVEECEMEKAISRASLELIPDAGHLVMLDAPRSVNVLIQRFLKRWKERDLKTSRFTHKS